MFTLLLGCATPEQRAAQQQARYRAAKTHFDQTVKEYHLPSAAAAGSGRDTLLVKAAAGYEQVLRQYPDQPTWCAPALRSLGNVRAEQGRLDDAVRLYKRVGERYPQQDWEVLQAWKSAADLLWEAGRQPEARAFYTRIVERYDQPDAPAVVRTVVRGARSRLGDSSGD